MALAPLVACVVALSLVLVRRCIAPPLPAMLTTTFQRSGRR